jgi:ABC-type bacteriocin/lantibiotic exporter with double-glycine peptidase domain
LLIIVIKTKGSNISGGQNQRVNIARALYSDPDIIIFDNSFSSIDNNVAFAIMEKAIIPLRQSGKIVIIATNDKKWLRYADKVYQLENNKVVEVDKDSLDTKFINYNYSNDTIQSEINIPTPIESEDEDTKRVSLNTYLYFLRNTGVIAFVMVIVWVALMQFGRNFIEIWMAEWVQGKQKGQQEVNLRLYVLLVVIHTIITILRSERFATVCLKACKQIYEDFITKLLNSQIDFFMNNDIAKLSNILQKDIFEIDEKIPFELNRLLAYTFSLVGSIIVLSYSSLYFITLSPFVGIYYYNLFKYFNSASRVISKKISAANESYVSTFLDTIE